MFTGIIEELGVVKNIKRRGPLAIFEIKAGKVLEDIRIGDSIAVNGTCLTVIKREADYLSFEVMPETLKSSNLGSLTINS